MFGLWTSEQTQRTGTIFLVMSLCFTFLCAAKSRDRNYENGLERFKRGRYKEAITEFQKAAKKARSGEDLGRIYKYIAYAYFTTGKRDQAGSNFKKCLMYDINCQAKDGEFRDPTAIAFFETIKEGKAAPPKAEKKPESQAEAKLKAQTRIFIESNVKKGDVLIGGILAGSLGSPINAPAGTVEIQVFSEGYKTRTTKIAVREGKDNVYEVPLEKIVNEERKSEGIRPKARISAESTNQSGKNEAKKKGEHDRADGHRLANAPPVLPDESEPDELVGKAKIPRDKEVDRRDRDAFVRDRAADKRDRDSDRRTKEAERREREANTRDIDEESQIRDSNRRQPDENRRERTSDDRRDWGGNVDRPPYPTPGELRGQPDGNGGQAAIDQPKRSLSLLHFLPFGSGQFMNGDFIAGSAIFGVEVYALYSYAQSSQRIQQAKDNLRAANSAYAKDGSTITAEQLAALQDRAVSFVKEERSLQDMYLGVFFGVYAVGVLQATLMSGPNPVSPSSAPPSSNPPPSSPFTPPRPSYSEVTPETLHWSIEPYPYGELRLLASWKF